MADHRRIDVSHSTENPLTCGPERIAPVRGMTNLERICATGWDVNAKGCWVWRGELFKGRAKLNTTLGNRNAARVLWQELHGAIEPHTLNVRHKCDFAACVNPDHLELGTWADNVADMRERPRGWVHVLRRDDPIPAERVYDGPMWVNR